MKRTFPQKASVVEMSGEAASLPAETNSQMNQMSVYCNNSDATMCSFIFTMQQRNLKNHQFAQQCTIERLEIEMFLHSRH